jgi:type II secretory pathway pseudopilin PulG
MANSSEGKNPPYLQIALAVITLLGVIATALAPQIFRDPPEALVQLTAQAIQTQGAFTAIAQQLTLAAQFTETPTHTESPTSAIVVATDTSTLAPTLTDTDTPTPIPPTITFTATHTVVPASRTPLPTNTINPITEPSPASLTPISAPTIESRTYPCEGVITNPDSSASIINVIYLEASQSAQLGQSIRVGSTVTIQRTTLVSNEVWYLIYANGERLGWIAARYIRPSSDCPS